MTNNTCVKTAKPGAWYTQTKYEIHIIHRDEYDFRQHHAIQAHKGQWLQGTEAHKRLL